MADNYRARINSIGTFLYKNSRIGEDLTGKLDHVTVSQYVYVPNISNIDLSQFVEAYAENDTERVRPYYVRLFRDPLYTKYSYPDDTVAETEKLNLGNNKITFFSIDDSENILGLKDLETDPTLTYNNAPFAPNKYSLAAPFSNGAYGSKEYYQFAYTPDIQSADRQPLGGYKALRTIVDGEGIEGLKPFKNDLLDAVLIPYNIGTGQVFNNANMFYKDENGEEFAFGFSAYVAGQPYTYSTQKITYNDTEYNTICYTNRDVFSVKGIRPSTGLPYKVTSVHSMCSAPGKNGTTSEGWTYYALSNTTGGGIISFAFLCDDNGDIWILSVSQGGWQAGTDSVYPGKFVSYAVLTKVDNLPSTRVVTNNNNQYGYPNLTMVDRVDLQQAFKKMLKLETYSYDDGAPDIVGPGDPYEEDSNAGESVGGDSDTTDVIETPDTTPNVSYENFIINNGLYGSYSLTPDNLKNYTKTIQICRDNSWLPGELGDKCEQMANLIQENTTNVFMLPVSIPNEETELTAFNVGTKGIRNVDTLGQFGEESSVDQARLIKKFTAQYTVSIGTIRHYYDNFLDFAPFSSASLYIPYIGKVELPINLIQSTSTSTKDISLSMRLNRTNGDLLCILFVDNIPICRWQGNCARNIAMSVNDNSGILQNQFGRLVASLSSGVNAIGSAATGNIGGAASGLLGMASAPLSGGAPITTSSHMIGGAPESGDTGWLDSQNIILTIERPIWWKPYDYGELIGYPTKKIAKLSSVKGFARVPQIHIRCSATESEKERLKNMLAEGVLF